MRRVIIRFRVLREQSFVDREPLQGRVEVDEAFVGDDGEAIYRRQTESKAVIAVALERVVNCQDSPPQIIDLESIIAIVLDSGLTLVPLR